MKKTWLVTGASKGLGWEITKSLLEKGYQVIAGSRNADKLSELNKEFPDSLLPVTLDIKDIDSAKEAVSKGIEKFGQIDVLVNNAGYGLLGALEEFSNKQIQDCFDVNVFGLINMTKAILPHFRENRNGLILNMASISGTAAGPATSIYSATKASVIQISESLNFQLDQFNINVVALCPGGFRTDFLDSSSMIVPDISIPDYQSVHDSIANYEALNHKQGGDPSKFANILIALSKMELPPTRLYVGTDALRVAERKFSELERSIESYFDLSKSTDFTDR